MNKQENTKHILGALFFFLFSFQHIYSQVDTGGLKYDSNVSRRGTAAGSMLEIGVGARAEALGGAFVAIANDPSALYWNPAGITQIKSLSLQATKTDWFVGTDFNVIDLVVPIPSISSALGLHIAMLDYGENPVRTVFRPEGTGETYSAFDFAAGLYWALNITEKISAGFGLKYFNQSIWHVDGSTMAMDLSLLFETPLEGFKIGGVISNLGPDFSLFGRDLTRVADVDGRRSTNFNNDNVPINLATESYPLPLLFRFGLSYQIDLNKKNSLIFAGNVNHPSDDVETVDLGLEARVFNSAYIRAGYQSLFADYAANGLTLGGGISYKILNVATITVDYSWSDWSVLSTVNRFTVGISGY